MRSSELMMLAENGGIEIGEVVVDQDDNEFVFTGKSFQLLHIEKASDGLFYTLCVGDDWKLKNEIVQMIEWGDMGFGK